MAFLDELKDRAMDLGRAGVAKSKQLREGEPPQITRDAAKPRAPIKNAGVTL